MSRVVLDASAILALLNDEPGARKLTPALLANAVASTVNLTEVCTKLIHAGGHPDEAWQDSLSPIRQAMPFTPVQARLAASLASQTRPLGLSLGDRACLALGIALNAPVFTADKSWTSLKLSVRIHSIR